MADKGAADTERVAVIGLGKMGLPMARCLIAAGFDVGGYDVSAAALDAFKETGGAACRSASEAVAGAGIDGDTPVGQQRGKST